MKGYFVGNVRVDAPAMPNAKFAGASFPTSAPANNRLVTQGLSNEEGIITLTHNSSTASLSFQLYIWSDVAGYWMPFGSPVNAAQYALVILGKVPPRVPVFVAASAGLSTSNVVLGGLTTFGINSTPSA